MMVMLKIGIKQRATSHGSTTLVQPTLRSQLSKYFGSAADRLMCVCLLSFPMPSFAESSFAHASVSQKDNEFFSYAVRVRSEHVDVAGDQGAAFTTKFRLNLKHQISTNWHAVMQLDHVESLFGDRHSDGVIVTNEPVIADPESTEFNQAYLGLSVGSLELTVGRQSISFGDHRFVGDVGFRQNDQTFDGVRLEYESVEGLTVNYAFLTQVNRILGKRAGETLSQRDIRFDRTPRRPGGQLGRHDVDAHLLNVEMRLADYVDVSAFTFAVHNHDFDPFSNRTVGVSADWKYKVGNLGLSASMILARQKKQQVEAGQYQDFWRLGFGVKRKAWHLEFRQEHFGSDASESFVTPLATLHKFQGWADQFLSTPSEGLRDSSLRLMWKQRPFTIDYRHHQFRTVASLAGHSKSVGVEHNLDLIFKPVREHEVKIRLADYKPESAGRLGKVRTKKLFLMYSYGF